MTEFVEFYKPKKLSLGIRTTCRCENLFKNIKHFITEKNTFIGFFQDITGFLNKRKNNYTDKFKKTYLKVLSYQGTDSLMGMKLVLTNHTYKYLSETYIHTKNICKIDANVLPYCSVCSWDVKEGLPCLYQLKNGTIDELILLTARRWRKDYLFECYGLEYTNREIHIENEIKNRKQTVPIKTNNIPLINNSYQQETLNKVPEVLEKEHKKVLWNALTELNVKIASYFYSSDIRKIKGEQCLEKIIEILRKREKIIY